MTEKLLDGLWTSAFHFSQAIHRHEYIMTPLFVSEFCLTIVHADSDSAAMAGHIFLGKRHENPLDVLLLDVNHELKNESANEATHCIRAPAVFSYLLYTASLKEFCGVLHPN